MWWTDVSGGWHKEWQTSTTTTRQCQRPTLHSAAKNGTADRESYMWKLIRLLKFRTWDVEHQVLKGSCYAMQRSWRRNVIPNYVWDKLSHCRQLNTLHGAEINGLTPVFTVANFEFKEFPHFPKDSKFLKELILNIMLENSLFLKLKRLLHVWKPK